MRFLIFGKGMIREKGGRSVGRQEREVRRMRRRRRQENGAREIRDEGDAVISNEK